MNPAINNAGAKETEAPPSIKKDQNFVPETLPNVGAALRIVRPGTPAVIPFDRQKLSNPGACIAEINKRYAVVKLGGKALVVDEQGGDIEFLSFPDFERFYSNIEVPLGKGHIQLGRHWLKHPDRRQYLDGVAFDPSPNTRPGLYNLWAGYAVEPDPSHRPTLFLEHLLVVICSGNQEHCKYLLNWLALLVQQPWLLPGVALVLLSDQGTGKGLFVAYLGKIFGRHYKPITNRSHLVGNFSGHLQDAVLVFADELSWDGSKADAGVLKALITEPTRMMEKKFADAVQVRNCMHLIIASNENWAIPAEMSDRRYCVLKVSSCKKADHAYFDAFAVEMNGDGPSGLLAFLLQRDISAFKASNFPKTAARVNQQLQSLEPVDEWLSEQLQLGFLCTGTGLTDSQWPEKADKNSVYDSFSIWFRKRMLKQSLPNLSVFTSKLKIYGISTCRMSAQRGGKRSYGYNFPTLDALRRQFETKLGSKVDWEGSDDE